MQNKKTWSFERLRDPKICFNRDKNRDREKNIDKPYFLCFFFRNIEPINRRDNFEHVSN